MLKGPPVHVRQMVRVSNPLATNWISIKSQSVSDFIITENLAVD